MNAFCVFAKVKDKIMQLFVANLLRVDSFKGFYHVGAEFRVSFQPSSIGFKERIVKWLKPLEGCFKLNIDSCVKNFKSSCGDIISDFKGHVIVAFEVSSNADTTIKAEIEALLFCLELCMSLCFTNVWIEIDAMLLILYIEGNSIFNSALFYMLKDIKH
ncbi:hypothetical protein KFK09_009497 [Dendrobium nobile]|uniref:RNase H type-1 domain-containing protein n=1 Tax=Dendrobium nobile TaxID=94219 RepID=A0A8T3BHM2_DENNO|nr:hypothetical protein KFK09_009497 [Dendrobium nobile]